MEMFLSNNKTTRYNRVVAGGVSGQWLQNAIHDN